jgi:hypothetical protein
MAENPSNEARIFSAKTRFQTLARRPGGVTRSKAVENAMGKIDEAKLGFDDWLDGELTELIGAVERAKAGEAVDEWIDTAQFHTNQMRNVGTTVGFSSHLHLQCSSAPSSTASKRAPNAISVAHLRHALLLIRQKQFRHLRPDQVLTACIRSPSVRHHYQRAEVSKSTSLCFFIEPTRINSIELIQLRPRLVSPGACSTQP